VLQSPALTGTHGERTASPFGSSPKISTPVENIVEKHRLNVDLTRKSLVLGQFSGGEAAPIAVLRASADDRIDTLP
jgi:hypothetical protein